MDEQRHRTRHEHQQRRQTVPDGGRFAQRPVPGVAHSREQQQADRRQDAQARPGRDAPRRASAQRQIVRRLAGRNQPAGGASPAGGPSPLSRKSTDTPNSSLSLTSRSASGTDCPDSHLDTDWRVTSSRAASSSCDHPAAWRRPAIFCDKRIFNTPFLILECGRAPPRSPSRENAAVRARPAPVHPVRRIAAYVRRYFAPQTQSRTAFCTAKRLMRPYQLAKPRLFLRRRRKKANSRCTDFTLQSTRGITQPQSFSRPQREKLG